jgi:methyl-accepting chemotaxis protein
VNEVMSRFLVIPPVMQLVTFLVVITAIVLFFRRKVASPVAGINAALARITEGDLVAPVPSVDGAEIGSIADGVRFLAGKLGASLTRVNTLSNDAASALERLTAALSVVRDATAGQAASIESVMAVIRRANERQRSSTEGTDRMTQAAFDNASALLEMRSAADEIAASTDRLFRSAADSHAMISEMSSSAMAIAERSGEVFLALENTSSSINEIGASLAAVRENAARSAEFSAKVRRLLSERGTLAVAEAIEAMERIAGEVDRFEQTVRQLDLRSKDIEGVLTVINDVTERTKLLSLNASILAAQAGEQGRGFAVVAEEVRALSEGTTASAKDIASIVRSIRTQIKEAAEAVHTGVRKVDEGKDLIAKSGEAMGEILEAAQQSARMTNAVEKATSEQAEGLLQIRVAMENIRGSFEQIAKSTEEERRNAARMLDTIAGVKEAAGIVKRGAGEQAAGTQAISKNLEESRDMVARIHRAAQDQLTANEAVVASVESIRRTGQRAMEDLEGRIRSFGSLKAEVEALKGEMAFFRTERT